MTKTTEKKLRERSGLRDFLYVHCGLDSDQLLSVMSNVRTTEEVDSAIKEATEAERESKSDGHHTFDELYEHRHALFSLVCKAYGGWKSKLHDDGTMFDGWFVAGVETPSGQATYHLPMEWWDRFDCKELDKAPKWDGHTANDVIERLKELSQQKE